MLLPPSWHSLATFSTAYIPTLAAQVCLHILQCAWQLLRIQSHNGIGALLFFTQLISAGQTGRATFSITAWTATLLAQRSVCGIFRVVQH